MFPPDPLAPRRTLLETDSANYPSWCVHTNALYCNIACLQCNTMHHTESDVNERSFTLPFSQINET